MAAATVYISATLPPDPLYRIHYVRVRFQSTPIQRLLDAVSFPVIGKNFTYRLRLARQANGLISAPKCLPIRNVLPAVPRVLNAPGWCCDACGGACQAGEARASAAMARRIAARPQSRATGQPDAMAILMPRTLMHTRAPIMSSLSRWSAGGSCEVVSEADAAQGAERRAAHRPSGRATGAAGWRAS